MTMPGAVTIDAPAKINLGLEILGKRTDGYHDIRSVMVMLELSDTLRIFAADAPGGLDLTDLPAEANLVTHALRAFRDLVPASPCLGWTMTKRVPAAAGLGGASADAAAALVAANQLAGNPLSHADLASLAGHLGSDITFFLGTPVAMASGRGTDLEAMPTINQPVGLIVPRVAIAGKTKRLYSMISPADFSDGSRSVRVRQGIERGCLPSPPDLANAFSRPLSSLVPGLRDLELALQEHGIERFALSGAGPAHYVIGQADSDRLAIALDEDLRLAAFDVIPTRTRLMPLVARPSLARG